MPPDLALLSKEAAGMANKFATADRQMPPNSLGSDQTALIGAVSSGSAFFAWPICPNI